MDTGIGLPSTVPGTPGRRIIEWSRAAEQRSFSTLGAIDRLVYGNDEPLVTLGAAAAVTERITLMTSVSAAALTDTAAVHDAVAAYAEAGCDELILAPCSSDPEQVHLLADALGR
jgi:hypothetical protein